MLKPGTQFSIFFIIIVLFWNCTTDKKVNTEAVQQEIASREIKKVSEAEILEKATEIGNEISAAAKMTLGKNLKAALSDGGVENAISFCNLNAMPLVDSLNKKFDARIKRVTLKTRNPNDFPNDIERKILDAYAYQWKDSIALKENVQKLDSDNYLFNKPILVDNELCLKCHGVLGQALTQSTSDFIKSRYPLDKAIGYKIGDLRGMWSITLSKKKVIQSM